MVLSKLSYRWFISNSLLIFSQHQISHIGFEGSISHVGYYFTAVQYAAHATVYSTIPTGTVTIATLKYAQAKFVAALPTIEFGAESTFTITLKPKMRNTSLYMNLALSARHSRFRKFILLVFSLFYTNRNKTL